MQGIKQAMIEYWEPKLNDWRYKLQLIHDLNIDGWHDFQKVNLGIWAMYRDAVMPTPVPANIDTAYRKQMRDNNLMPLRWRATTSRLSVYALNFNAIVDYFLGFFSKGQLLFVTVRTPQK